MQDGQRGVEWIESNRLEGVVEKGAYGGQQWVEVASEVLVDLCRELKENPDTSYDFLVDVTAVHRPERREPMEMVYHLYSFAHDDCLRLKVRCGDEGPVPSLCSIWRAADWNERETYDMFGIRFDGHPDLRRILMYDEFVGFPLRKDYPQNARQPLIRRPDAPATDDQTTRLLEGSHDRRVSG